MGEKAKRANGDGDAKGREAQKMTGLRQRHSGALSANDVASGAESDEADLGTGSILAAAWRDLCQCVCVCVCVFCSALVRLF